MTHQEIIRQNDMDFYEAILPHIHLMPDFRPQETVRQMKK